MPDPIDSLDFDFLTSDRGGEYFTKLNASLAKVKELVAGVNAQFLAGEDAATILATLQQLQTELTEELTTIRNETTSIATNSLLWQTRLGDSQVAAGEKLFLGTPGQVIGLATFKASIETGQWFALKNISSANVFLAGIAGISLVGKSGTVEADDRLVIKPGSTRYFVAISTTKVEVK